MKKVSFLIPAYNHAEYIASTLDSIYADDYPNKEIIVIDDGSTDDTRMCVKQWIADHPGTTISFYTRGNRGVTATLNELIRAASGEFLRLFSSDDILINGSTMEMAGILERDESLSAVFTDVMTIDTNGKITASSALKVNGARLVKFAEREGLKAEIISNWAVSGPAILIRRAWYLQEGFYKEDMLIDDWDLYLRLISRDRLAFCNIQSAQYRVHDANTCRTPVVGKRIKNLESQLHAGTRNLPRFSGRMRLLLKAECALIKAKIAFLSRNYFDCTQWLAMHFFFSFRARL